MDDFIKNIFIKPNIRVTTNQLPSNPQNVILFFILPTSLSIHFWKYSNKFIIPETIQLADIIINAILQPIETSITKQNAYKAINANIIHTIVVIKRTLLFSYYQILFQIGICSSVKQKADIQSFYRLYEAIISLLSAIL